MTDTPKADAARVLTEDEAYAIVADRVKRETADRDNEIAQLKAANADLAKEVDLKVAAFEAEKARADAAEKGLDEFKVQVENEKAAAARTEERVSKVREVAKHLDDKFFTPERASRWASMEDAQFEDYIRELAEVSVLPSTTATSGEPPRETAMAGAAVEEKTTGNLAKLWGVN